MNHACLRRFPLLTLAVALTLLTLPAAPGRAAFTGLTQIPTAESLLPGEYEFEIELDRALPGLVNEETLLDSQIGFRSASEAGLDLAFGGDSGLRILPNYKYVISPIGKTSPGLAAGFGPVDTDLSSSPYLTAGRNLGPFRGHAGVFHVGDTVQWFAGVDRALSDDVVLMGDYVSGDENASSVGVSVELAAGYGILVGVLLPNAAGEDTVFTLQIGYGGRLGRHKQPGEPPSEE